MTRWAMVIDLKRCIGCWACALACKLENNEPQGIWWNRILTVGGSYMDTPEGRYPDLKKYYIPINCQHCENPPCVKVCPTGATYRREEDGVVIVDYEKCVGCRYCMVACPYEVRKFNWEEPEQMPKFKVGDADVPDRYRGVVEKCTLCDHRLVKGLKPFCIDVCPARARHFGDLDNPDSEVSKIIRTRHVIRLLEELGTKPRVFYLPP